VDLFDEEFDPFGPTDVERIHPVWITTPVDVARRGRLSYDRTVDAFFVKPEGVYRGGVAVLVGDERFARYAITDMESDIVVALMVEGFLRRVVKEIPALFDELERAQLRGIAIDEIRELRRSAVAEGLSPGPTLAEFYAPEAWSRPVITEAAESS